MNGLVIAGTNSGVGKTVGTLAVGTALESSEVAVQSAKAAPDFIDASAGMESVAATALGFKRYVDETGRNIEVAGIIAQRCHGGRHETGMGDALPDGLRYFGRIPPSDELEMGTEAAEQRGALREAAAPATRPESGEDSPPQRDATVAVARDDAFCFTYPATIERLNKSAEIVTFAPATDETLPSCDGVYLPGGYPELAADALASSGALDDIAMQASEGLPILGECGGLMALCDQLRTTDGEQYEMSGVLPATVQMHDHYQALDHVELAAQRGERRRANEFHYATLTVESDAAFAFEMVRGDGITDDQDGLTEYNTLGTDCHLHPDSGAFDTFVEVL
jgi:cobyrinic acid a,c-diamide synthase